MKHHKIFILLFICQLALAQNGFEITNTKENKISFPIKVINNLIIIPINVNGVSLDFLLDTGISETILFSLQNKNVNFKNVEKIKLTGLGENNDIEALKSINNKLNIDGKLLDNSHNIFIILDENFNISSTIGVPINGIIGYHFFRNHPVAIDYIKKKITVYTKEIDLNKITKRFQKQNIKLELNKPYLMAEVEMTHEKRTSKMLLDTGNTDSIWLFPTLIPGFNYNRPNIDDFLGSGFSGDIYGKRSRIHGLYFGNFSFIKPLVAMPDATSIQHLKLVPDRKGSIGSEILRRFTVIYDYPNEAIYFKKNKYYDDDFPFDMSGLEIKQDGLTWDRDLVKIEIKPETTTNETTVYKAESQFQYKFTLKPTYIVSGSRKDSPAQLSGLMKNDVLVSINNKKASDLSLQKIQKMLKSAEGTTITLDIIRNEIPMTFSFILEDPIPYQEQ